jgi:hypothetical protein
MRRCVVLLVPLLATELCGHGAMPVLLDAPKARGYNGSRFARLRLGSTLPALNNGRTSIPLFAEFSIQKFVVAEARRPAPETSVIPVTLTVRCDR